LFSAYTCDTSVEIPSRKENFLKQIAGGCRSI
jgi:hypothetical protein